MNIIKRRGNKNSARLFPYEFKGDFNNIVHHKGTCFVLYSILKIDKYHISLEKIS